MGSITKLINRIRCNLSYHPVLHIIQNFGQAKHVGCPYCKREFAMHDGMQTFLPWDDDFEELYGEVFKYNIDEFRHRWLSHIALKGKWK